MYLLGQSDLGTLYPERDLSTNSPSEEEDEGSDEYGSESDIDQVSGDVESEESLLRTVVGPNGLKNFVLPLIWMVNDFNLTIQRKHFNTLGIGTKFPLMSSFVCHTNLKSATTIVLLMSRCMSR